ncbi:MAG: Ig-like domain-containing protein, partial [Chitinispirillia bacterium]|nr:Ig-like domain-containing protein [Chitinispirillia bacterium]
MQRFFLTISALMVIFTAGAAAAQTGGSVASFAPLADNVRYQRTSNPVLPGNVSAVLDDGTSAQIPVTWAADGYNGFGTVTGLYVFHASVDTARAPLMAPLRGVDPPKITVMLLPLFVPAMAGIGDAASPLQVINAAQLAEIAE